MTGRAKEILTRLSKKRIVIGVEIGVWRGSLSKELLERRPKLELWMVDPWRESEPGSQWEQSGSRMATDLTQCELNIAFEQARALRERMGGRAKIVRATSSKAVYTVPSGLDFVFVDGDHSYEGCKLDIELYTPKLVRARNSWIGGHDFGGRFEGVDRAVREAFGDRFEVGEDKTWFAYPHRD